MTTKKEKFEDHLKQVEDVIKNLESGKLGLEESLEQYEVGIHALKKCYEILETAEKKIEVLLKEKDGSLKTEPLKPPRSKESPDMNFARGAGKGEEDVPF